MLHTLWEEKLRRLELVKEEVRAHLVVLATLLFGQVITGNEDCQLKYAQKERLGDR